MPDKQLKIITQEFIREALNTIPIVPQSSDITFLSHGLENVGAGNSRQYERNCAERNVAPYSFINYRFDSHEKRFLEDMGLSFRADPIHVVQGRRINKLRFRDGFKTLKSDLLKTLFEEGYQVNKAMLVIDFQESEITSTRIEFDFNYGRGLWIDYNAAVSVEVKNPLERWFDSLESKFGTK